MWPNWSRVYKPLLCKQCLQCKHDLLPKFRPRAYFFVPLIINIITAIERGQINTASNDKAELLKRSSIANAATQPTPTHKTIGQCDFRLLILNLYLVFILDLVVLKLRIRLAIDKHFNCSVGTIFDVQNLVRIERLTPNLKKSL